MCGGFGADLSELEPEQLSYRKANGCDGPCGKTKRERPRITCGRCGGAGAGLVDGRKVECGRCRGEGSIKLTRCPSFYEEAWQEEFFEAYSFLESGILPDAGGFQDQTADFVQVVRAIRDQKAECDRQEEEGRKRLAKAAQGGKRK